MYQRDCEYVITSLLSLRGTHFHSAFLAAVDSGEIKIKALKIPTLCYPFGHKYLPGQLDKNLFKGELAVRVSGYRRTCNVFGSSLFPGNQPPPCWQLHDIWRTPCFQKQEHRGKARDR